MRWSMTTLTDAEGEALRLAVDASPGKPVQEVRDRRGRPLPGAVQVSEVALVASETEPGRCYVGLDSPWAIGTVNTLEPGLAFAPDGFPPGFPR